MAWVERWPDWPAVGLIITGPPASGRSHLARLWADLAGAIWIDGPDRSAVEALLPDPPSAVVIDDADRAAPRSSGEEGLFHLLNGLKAGGGHILLTALAPPARWDLGLADLASRVRALPVAQIGAPDDVLLAAVIAKQFADRQIAVEPGVVDFLIRRMERSFRAAADLVAAIDRAALAGQRPITRQLAAHLLDWAPDPDGLFKN